MQNASSLSKPGMGRFVFTSGIFQPGSAKTGLAIIKISNVCLTCF
jgi:hypothetical protein